MAVAAIAAAFPVLLGQGGGRVAVRITENGRRATGTFTLFEGGRPVATGTADAPAGVAPGRYRIVVRLDGALDRPEIVTEVDVAGGAVAVVPAPFSTGTLDIAVQLGGRRVAASVAIFRAGGTASVAVLSSGVRGVLSAGEYDLQVRYRDTVQSLRVVVPPGGTVARTVAL